MPPLLRATTISSPTSLLISFPSSSLSLPKPYLFLSKFPSKSPCFPQLTRSFSLYSSPKMNWLGRLGFAARAPAVDPSSAAIAEGPDDNIPAPGQQFAQFGAGCFWGPELAFQRVFGVTKTEVGYSQGFVHNPTYGDVCTGMTNHNEVVRVQYDPKECSYETLLDVFWSKHDPTTLNRQVCLV